MRVKQPRRHPAVELSLDVAVWGVLLVAGGICWALDQIDKRRR